VCYTPSSEPFIIYFVIPVHKITEMSEKEIVDIADRKLCQQKIYGSVFRPTSSYSLKLLGL
jgi:hypothetical protein